MVIIGAGECGARAAFALREHGYDGPVTLVGDEPHHPYERPPLSKDALTLADAPPPKWVSTARRFSPRNASPASPARAPWRSTARPKPSASPTARRCPMTSCCWRPARCRAGCRLPNRPATASPICATFADALRIRDHLAARDAASRSSAAASSGSSSRPAPRKRGAEVTIIEAQPRILMRGVPEEIAAVVAARHLRRRRRAHLRDRPDGNRRHARTASGSSSATAARSMPIWR